MAKVQDDTHQLIYSNAFWNTSEAEVSYVASLARELTNNDPKKIEHLDLLLEWAKQQGSLDEAYNNADFSGE